MKEIGEMVNQKEKVYYYYNSGNRYEGDFKDGEREGKGIMF